MWHVREYHITTAEVLTVLGLRGMEKYVCRRQLQWAGHVARMGPTRLPRQFLTSWCGRPTPPKKKKKLLGERHVAWRWLGACLVFGLYGRS